ncbi:uncharacterized protein CXorf65 homolog isoform X1 [Corvus cornix cornix]|uniref:uncharacterized protein CXorf65 homolog isoform X1 n=1 Tax=Corvus cornix cornix TaxID=932674 RepID=UPI0005359B71|nr:uncharacterized protein CXorf65 homolog isoform X1 [Corvus cornix cornix]XP_017593904.1 PREDICTED: uncharacterized protein CXorf65 homolog isoform X2 [Corvus brachyrhynchos]XP_017593905.1 PREDICTED: uncharacterized protein CXorf65 homolog isoform X2 [Corvus brachyrhynchos]XP_017593906.1 PREDICTED: uncharacterized protein CXorf65 homolog isoform X2 [Corvus brachyrhynchos]XP_041890245.1 uncharacterized protein CXorf65 homolog isoform X1 [Corvus kubaryi]
MFITVLHGENEKALFNINCKVQPLLDSIKHCCGCEEGDEIELADEHGQVKNLLQHQEHYGWQLLQERELCVLLKVTRQEGSQEAVFTPLLKNQSIVTPKFLAKLGKSEDSKVSLARGKTRNYGKKANLLLEAPSTAGKKSQPQGSKNKGSKNKTLGSTSKGTGKH